MLYPNASEMVDVCSILVQAQAAGKLIQVRLVGNELYVSDTDERSHLGLAF